jgi:hypothetical protein
MITNLKKKLAAWLDPEAAANAEKYLVLHRELYDLKLWFVNVPEIHDAVDWALGRTATQTSKDLSPAVIGSMFPSYKRYPNMVQFREVIETEYQRKTTLNPNSNVRY